VVTFIVLNDPVLILRDSLLAIIHKLVQSSLNSRCQEYMHAMTLKISVSQSLPSRYNRAFGLFRSVICIVCSSILPVLAKVVLWVSTQSFFPPYRTIDAGLCLLKFD
jgi:hypothetical protein